MGEAIGQTFEQLLDGFRLPAGRLEGRVQHKSVFHLSSMTGRRDSVEPHRACVQRPPRWAPVG